ncbi:MAG TPA: lytic transglycosylase domain-containing protein [Mycobacteriales bacterium]|nr:lytic transglycosylase domain-containing protein [Mycobacteriales bacterium]
MRQRLAGRHGVQVAVVATALVGVLAGGAVGAAALRDEPAPAAASLDQSLGAPERADRQRTVTPKGAVPPSPVQITPGAVAPLRALRTADVVVRSAAPLPADVVARLRALDGVVAGALLDAGTATLGSTELAVVGADPSELRGFTPEETASSDPLWQAVARGELALGHAVQRDAKLPLGGDVELSGRSLRLGAIAEFGLPRTDAVVSRSVARALGATPDAVLVLAAPEAETDDLERAVRAVAGDAVQVDLLRPPDVAPSRLQGRPSSWRELYIDSARYCPGLSWTVLAAIGQVESAHGKHLGPSSAGALGPMQFLPSTWEHYGLDGDGDGEADIMNPLDAVPSAAHYLCVSGASRGESGLYDAIFAYNHADWYVQKVLALAAQYR